MSTDKIKLANLLSNPPEGYDTTYQDIECISYKGYSRSYQTWNNIKELVDWKDKLVYDLSSFHGYFLFKVIDTGANPGSIGYDRCEPALETSRLINNIRGGEANFVKWEAGEVIEGPEPDIMLCLNCFHHYGDQMIPAIKNMRAKKIIFEIMRKDVDVVSKYSHVMSSHASARPERIIMICQK